ncbi:MAG TPA: WbqC family protein [Methylophilaceae bacterium]|nr:WbqC family protein [Methylophilaceae bacterium]
MKVVVIHQPDFLPYLGFFHRLLHADLFVLLDHVQFVTNGSRSWTHRDKIKTAQGERWLTVGVKKVALGTPINEVLLADTDWRQQSLNLLRENYRNAPHFSNLFPEVEKLYAMPCERLVEFNVASVNMLLEWFDLKIPVIYSSHINPEGKKNELLVDILTKVSASHYLSGVGARSYFEPEPFSAAGLEVQWQDFKHPLYPQQFGEFIPYLSSLDLFFNCGIDNARQILRNL